MNSKDPQLEVRLARRAHLGVFGLLAQGERFVSSVLLTGLSGILAMSG
jgi:hypothetical protein